MPQQFGAALDVGDDGDGAGPRSPSHSHDITGAEGRREGPGTIPGFHFPGR